MLTELQYPCMCLSTYRVCSFLSGRRRMQRASRSKSDNASRRNLQTQFHTKTRLLYRLVRGRNRRAAGPGRRLLFGRCLFTANWYRLLFFAICTCLFRSASIFGVGFSRFVLNKIVLQTGDTKTYRTIGGVITISSTI